MSRKTVLDFVNAINEKDIPKITALMAEDHVFIDAYGNRESREAMLRGWPGYFSWFPDYLIEVDTVLDEGDTTVILGYAGGTYKGCKTADDIYYWRIPAAWRGVADGDQVKIWQVYADSKIPYDTMDRYHLDHK